MESRSCRLGALAPPSGSTSRKKDECSSSFASDARVDGTGDRGSRGRAGHLHPDCAWATTALREHWWLARRRPRAVGRGRRCRRGPGARSRHRSPQRDRRGISGRVSAESGHGSFELMKRVGNVRPTTSTSSAMSQAMASTRSSPIASANEGCTRRSTSQSSAAGATPNRGLQSM